VITTTSMFLFLFATELKSLILHESSIFVNQQFPACKQVLMRVSIPWL